MERNEANTSMLWFLGGIALGSAVTLLIASDAGKKTGRQLVSQAQRGRRALSHSSQEIIEKGRELYERGRELAEEAADMFETGRQIAEKKIIDYV